MGRIVLIGRLAARDIRRHRAQALLLLLAITAAATTLVLGLALNGVTNHPYHQTRGAPGAPRRGLRPGAGGPPAGGGTGRPSPRRSASGSAIGSPLTVGRSRL